jgi:hypothetical protein
MPEPRWRTDVEVAALAMCARLHGLKACDCRDVDCVADAFTPEAEAAVAGLHEQHRLLRPGASPNDPVGVPRRGVGWGA